MTNEESVPAFTQNHHGCLETSSGLLANDFLYLLSETVRNVILTKFVRSADSDLLYISKLRPYITTWHRIPPSHNAKRAVRNGDRSKQTCSQQTAQSRPFKTDHSKQTTFITDPFITDPLITDHVHNRPVHNRSRS